MPHLPAIWTQKQVLSIEKDNLTCKRCSWWWRTWREDQGLRFCWTLMVFRNICWSKFWPWRQQLWASTSHIKFIRRSWGWTSKSWGEWCNICDRSSIIMGLIWTPIRSPYRFYVCLVIFYYFRPVTVCSLVAHKVNSDLLRNFQILYFSWQQKAKIFTFQ